HDRHRHPATGAVTGIPRSGEGRRPAAAAASSEAYPSGWLRPPSGSASPTATAPRPATARWPGTTEAMAVGWEALGQWGEDVARIEPLAGGVANDVWSVRVNGHLAVGRLGARSDAD